MDTVNQFNWPEVAAIAGATIVVLMALITALLAILLRRSGKQDNGDNGIIAQVKQIQHSIEGKIDTETENRKSDLALLRRSIEDGRRERRHDINTLHKKLESGLTNVVQDFKTMCDYRQDQCSATQRALVSGVKDQTITACKKIEKYESDQKDRWNKQEKFNLRFMGKAKNVNL